MSVNQAAARVARAENNLKEATEFYSIPMEERLQPLHRKARRAHLTVVFGLVAIAVGVVVILVNSSGLGIFVSIAGVLIAAFAGAHAGDIGDEIYSIDRDYQGRIPTVEEATARVASAKEKLTKEVEKKEAADAQEAAAAQEAADELEFRRVIRRRVIEGDLSEESISALLAKLA
ncbi:hypothetical protein [Leifsonia sp. Leaf264]|uniref:hypothetical protein n=1 Tax=Leifsonia sp. Leaf264 TaxID=1736314 RepID=UPI0006FF2CC4|nr:hypothetical protein [Leifsonia sp. Leaf264]KQO98564.1 hypothetical protein ASF30_10910 [Leifsonia sp. Leaf264]